MTDGDFNKEALYRPDGFPVKMDGLIRDLNAALGNHAHDTVRGPYEPSVDGDGSLREIIESRRERARLRSISNAEISQQLVVSAQEGEEVPKSVEEIEKENEQREAIEEAERIRRDGTLPEHVWGEVAGEQCREFLEIMREEGFPGAEVLTWTRTVEEREVVKRSLWGLRKRIAFEQVPVFTPEVRGYPIAVSAEPDKPLAPRRLVITHEPSSQERFERIQNVFLGEDGKLWLDDRESDKKTRITEEEWLSGANQSTEKDFVPRNLTIPLPATRAGMIFMPIVGYISQGYKYAERKQKQAEWWEYSVEKEEFPTKYELIEHDVKPTMHIGTIKGVLTNIALRVLEIK